MTINMILYLYKAEIERDSRAVRVHPTLYIIRLYTL